MEGEGEMNTCSNCKHWGVKDVDYNTGILGKPCGYVKMEWDCFEYVWDKNDDRDTKMRKGYENQKSFVKDGSDYYAELRTMPDFGCTQWEDS
jgi:hypothetical protein